MGVEKVVSSRLNVRSCRRDPSISQSPNGVTLIQPMRTTKENKSISVNFFVFKEIWKCLLFWHTQCLIDTEIHDVLSNCSFQHVLSNNTHAHLHIATCERYFCFKKKDICVTSAVENYSIKRENKNTLRSVFCQLLLKTATLIGPEIVSKWIRYSLNNVLGLTFAVFNSLKTWKVL